MRSFQFIRGENEAHVLETLERFGDQCRIIAGGQSLLLAMKARRTAPARLVDICRYPVRRMSQTERAVVLDARTTYRQLEEAAEVDGASGLSAVAADIADIPVRTMATVGGALCEANPAFDMPVVLTALDARVLLTSANGERSVELGDFFSADGRALVQPTEMLTSVIIPKTGPSTYWHFRKFRMRKMDPAAASVAIRLRAGDDMRITESRVVLGALTVRPQRLPELEAAMLGADLDELPIDELTDRMRGEIQINRPHPNFNDDYRKHIASVMLAQSLRRIAAETGPREAGAREGQGHGRG